MTENPDAQSCDVFEPSEVAQHKLHGAQAITAETCQNCSPDCSCPQCSISEGRILCTLCTEMLMACVSSYFCTDSVLD